MKIANGTKAKQPSSSKSHSKKSPNPTNFSNSRSNMYLTYNNSADFSAIKPSNGKIVSDLSKIGLPTPFAKPKAGPLELPPEDSKAIVHTPKRSPCILPQTAKAQGLNGKMFWTERQTPKAEFGPVHIQRMEKLEPKFLPISNESLIDLSIISNSAHNGAPACNASDSKVPPRKDAEKKLQIGICLYDSKKTNGIGSSSTSSPSSSSNIVAKPPVDKTIATAVNPLSTNKKAQNSPVTSKAEENKKVKRSRSEQRKEGDKEIVRLIRANTNNRPAWTRGKESTKYMKKFWKVSKMVQIV